MKFVPNKNNVRFLKLDDSFSAYEIVSEQQTPIVMQTFAQSRWTFPMTLYFESYSFEKDEILNAPYPVKEMASIKKIISFSTKGFHREYLPAFVLQIENEAMLEQALEEFFCVAEQNLFFALTNEPYLTYKGYHVTTTSETVEILFADYDGQAAIFLMNSKEDLYA